MSHLYINANVVNNTNTLIYLYQFKTNCVEMSILKFLCKTIITFKKKRIFQLSLHVMKIERDIFFNHPLSLCNFVLNGG